MSVTAPRSLVLATLIDVLPDDRVVRREGDHLLVARRGANAEVEIRRLTPAPGHDESLWEGAIAVALVNNAEDPLPDPDYERFVRARQAERRAAFSAGRGAWYVAVDPADGAVVAGCGVIATGPRDLRVARLSPSRAGVQRLARPAR